MLFTLRVFTLIIQDTLDMVVIDFKFIFMFHIHTFLLSIVRLLIETLSMNDR